MNRLKLLYLDFHMPYLLKDLNYPVGGATVEWYAWIKGFAANNHRVGVLTHKLNDEMVNASPGFDIVETYDVNEGIRILRWLYKRYPAMLKAVNNYSPDYIIQECAGFETGMMAYIGGKIGIPFIYRVANDMDTDNRYKERLSMYQRIAYRYGLGRADAVICQNNYQYEMLKKKYPNKKITIIHNPFYYEGELPEIKKQNERKYIAWLGVFQHQKNLPALFQIVKNLKDVEFWIAGKPGNHLDDDTKTALSNLRKCDNAKFVGYLKRTEIMHFLSNAYALVNTSHYEGFSNTFLESFLAGTPIVTTTGVDPDNIISKNNLGSISNNYEGIPDLAAALIQNIDYDKIAQRCRQYVLREHAPKVLAQKFAECLQDISP